MHEGDPISGQSAAAHPTDARDLIEVVGAQENNLRGPTSTPCPR